MGQALLFGLVASSALVIGAVVGLRTRLPERLLASVLAFASGALITALAFELFEDSYQQGGLWRAGLGMFLGAVVFTALSALLDRWAQPDAGGHGNPTEHGSAKLDKDAAATERPATAASATGTAGLALLAAVTLDGVPATSPSVSRSARRPVPWRCWRRSSCPTCPRPWSAAPRCALKAAPLHSSWERGRPPECSSRSRSSSALDRCPPSIRPRSLCRWPSRRVPCSRRWPTR